MILTGSDVTQYSVCGGMNGTPTHIYTHTDNQYICFVEMNFKGLALQIEYFNIRPLISCTQAFIHFFFFTLINNLISENII